jgi:hypothetical protein
VHNSDDTPVGRIEHRSSVLPPLSTNTRLNRGKVFCLPSPWELPQWVLVVLRSTSGPGLMTSHDLFVISAAREHPGRGRGRAAAAHAELSVTRRVRMGRAALPACCPHTRISHELKLENARPLPAPGLSGASGSCNFVAIQVPAAVGEADRANGGLRLARSAGICQWRHAGEDRGGAAARGAGARARPAGPGLGRVGRGTLGRAPGARAGTQPKHAAPAGPGAATAA